MFSKTGKSKKKMAKTNGNDINTTNIICAGTKIIGDVISDGNIRIDGELEGNLKASGKVFIGNTGVIKGTVSCKNSDIAGKLEGRLEISELLSLKATAKIFGDIFTGKLAIEPNAIFTGTCNMTDKNSNAEIQKQQKQEKQK